MQVSQSRSQICVKGILNQWRVLAALVFTFNPAAAFNPSGHRLQLPLGNPSRASLHTLISQSTPRVILSFDGSEKEMLSGCQRRDAVAVALAAGISQVMFSALSAAALEKPSSGGSGGEAVPDPDNIFYRILQGKAPADFVDNDTELVTFRDKRPASKLHLLVIPRRFIRDASRLQDGDMQLVEQMRRKARALVRAEIGEKFKESELALGFHWPPWYSVPWLHLHAIYPRSAISPLWRKFKYTPVTFRSPDWVLGRLRGETALWS
mmetsp:Transcript_42931/g.77017  ORF Transcript_42931/g.77017 Transcript_42931/m.77017 type:complete len:265 (-) Transcript_42931:89-883(-)